MSPFSNVVLTIIPLTLLYHIDKRGIFYDLNETHISNFW